MRLVSCLFVLAVTSACAAPKPPPDLSPADRVVFQTFVFAFSNLVERHWEAPVCAVVEHDGARSDPSDVVFQALRHRTSRVMAYHQCSSELARIDVLHDTLLVIVNPDSATSATPSVRVSTWRSGRWGKGYVCRLRQRGAEWEIDGCDVRWVASRARVGRRLTSG